MHKWETASAPSEPATVKTELSVCKVLLFRDVIPHLSKALSLYLADFHTLCYTDINSILSKKVYKTEAIVLCRYEFKENFLQ